MTCNIICPHCMRAPDVRIPEPLKSGLTIECPDCGKSIRFDLVMVRLEPKPVKPVLQAA